MNEIKRIKELEQQKEKLEIEINRYYRQKHEEVIKSNNKYVGRTFRKQEGNSICYYKIIKPHPDNEYRFYTFIFTLPFEIYLGHLSDTDCLCEIDDIGFLCNALFKKDKIFSGDGSRVIDYYEEISNEIFEEHFENYLTEIKSYLNNHNKI